MMSEKTASELLSLRVSAAATILAVSYRDPYSYVPLDHVYRDDDFRPATKDEAANDEVDVWRKRNGVWATERNRDCAKLFVLKSSHIEIAAREAVDRADAIIRRCTLCPLDGERSHA